MTQLFNLIKAHSSVKKQNIILTKLKHELITKGIKSISGEGNNLAQLLQVGGNLSGFKFSIHRTTCLRLEKEASSIYERKVRDLGRQSIALQISLDGTSVGRITDLNSYVVTLALPGGVFTHQMVATPQVHCLFFLM